MQAGVNLTSDSSGHYCLGELKRDSKGTLFEVRSLEDAVQISAVDFVNIDCVIARNTEDFTFISLEVYNPVSFLKRQI